MEVKWKHQESYLDIDYNDYLKSDHWLKLRKKMLRKRKKCQICG